MKFKLESPGATDDIFKKITRGPFLAMLYPSIPPVAFKYRIFNISPAWGHSVHHRVVHFPILEHMSPLLILKK